jgi:hypothetical protein
MCLIPADFKHFMRRKARIFMASRKVSSIMWAKVLSIMPTNAERVTGD